MSLPQKKLWIPTNTFINNSNLQQFEKWLAKEKDLHFDNYEALWQWSIDELEDFWASIAPVSYTHLTLPTTPYV